MSDYIPRTPAWFDVRKAAQVAAFFASRAGGKINIVKLMKLMYIADRRSIEARDMPITGDDFASMRFGPVVSHTYDIAKGAAVNRREEWDKLLGPRQEHDVPLARQVNEDDLDELSRSELRILDSVFEEFKDMDQWTIAEWAHKFCPEWRDPGNSSLSIPYATIGKRLQKPDPIGIAEEVDEHRRLSVTLYIR